MTKAIYDAAAILIPDATYSGPQNFGAVALAGGKLKDVAWIMNCTVPPSNDCTITLSAGDTASGPWIDILAYIWPAGLSGPHTVSLGLTGSLARLSAPTARFVRCRIAIPGGSIRLESWVTKGGGDVGLGTRPQDTASVT
jgi:hypothetical protein